MGVDVLEFRTAQDKAAWLVEAAEDDACCASVRELAAAFAGLEGEALARAIHRWVRDEIRYVRDPGGLEEFADSDVVLRRGWDDCDGKSRLFVATCIAAGLDARIVPVFDGPHFVHVQGEVRWPGQPWTLAELTLEGVELGQGVEAARWGSDGLPVTR